MNKIIKTKDKAANDLASKYCVNEQIRAERIIVVGAQGENSGALPRAQALEMAEQSNLDMVQVGEKDGVPVVKFLNFGKFLYEKKKQMHESKKNQKEVQVKEIKIRPNIDEQDYQNKVNQAERFFKEGKKVKFTLQFKGRQMAMMDDLGTRMFERISHDLFARNLGALVEEKDSLNKAAWTKIFYLKGK